MLFGQRSNKRKVVRHLPLAYNDATEVFNVEKQYEVSHSFQVVVTPDLDDDGYVVTVPSLPGCITEGDTIEEALHNVKDAIAFYVDHLKNRREHRNDAIVLDENTFGFLLNEKDDVYDEKYGYLLDDRK